MTDEIKQTAAQRRQVKFSGLIKGGVITPHDPADASQKYVSKVLHDKAEELPPATGQPEPTNHQPAKILLTLIDDSPYQPRMQYDPTEIDNLGHSLAAAGLEDPITVRKKEDGRYELIGGHRRVRAARSLGWAEITANFKDCSDRDAELATMVSNEARIDLTDYERGKLYQRAQESGFASTQTEVAHLFGTSQGRVSRCMAMLKLPNNYIAMLEAKPDLFGYNCAESVAQLLKEYPTETKLIEDGVLRIIEEGADQKSVKQWVQQMIKQKHSIDRPKERAVITDRAGREMFTANFSGREFTVRIKATEVDAKEVEEMVLATLRQRAEKISE